MTTLPPFVYSHHEKKILDLVIMNDKLCFHDSVLFKASQRVHMGDSHQAFAMPKGVYRPPTETREHEVTIKCPICDKKYPEASKRWEKELLEFYKESNDE